MRPWCNGSGCVQTNATIVVTAERKNSSKSPRSQNTYCIARVEYVNANGAPVRLWVVNVKRHGRLFARNFYDGVYGDRESALVMAIAYRDALQRLFPPLTQLEQRTKTRTNNKSGVPGVMAKFDRGRLKAWIATIEVAGVIHHKYFSVREHGEEKAKELAIEARHILLTQEHPNRFVTVNAKATQDAEASFPQLLELGHGAASTTDAHRLPPDNATIDRQLELLNAWVDALRPQFVHLRLSVYPIASRGYDSLFIVVGNVGSSGGAPGQLQRKSWTMQRRSYQDVLRLAWQYAQATVIEQMGHDCWKQFQELYQEMVFQSTPQQALYIRYRFDPPRESPLRTTPPSALMPMLAGIRLPSPQ